MEIDTPRCQIRHWRADETAALIEIANSPKIAQNMSNLFPVPYTEADAESWLDARKKDVGLRENYAIVIEGKLAGGISIHPRNDIHTGTAEVGYWLGEAFWGQGYMTEVLKTMIPFAFERFELHRLEAYHFGWNPASGRVLEKAGFVLEGCRRECILKNGDITDAFFYGLLRDETF